MVLAANEETGEVAYKEVVRTFVNTTDEIMHVTVNVGDGVLETIDSTPEHPFYVEGKGWVEASSLHAGMTIWFANGTKGTVEDITNEGLEEPVTVYNFEVKDFHTYFVGDSGVLVHNTCDPNAKYQVGAYEDIRGAEGLDAYHVGQKALMKDLVDNYDPMTAPAINVPREGHTTLGPNGIVSRSTKGITSARQLLARDIMELRKVYPDIPNSALRELIDMNKRMYPEMRK